MPYSYELERGSRKYRCPQCGRRTLVRFQNRATQQYVSEDVGRCDRQDKCGYMLTPREYFENTYGAAWKSHARHPRTVPEEDRHHPTLHLPQSMMTPTIGNYFHNTLARWLEALFAPVMDTDVIRDILRKCLLGTGSNGEAVYWQCDGGGHLRTGKVMAYDSSGHRLHAPGSTRWMHTPLLTGEEPHSPVLRQCYYLTHLANDNPHAALWLMESEKAALVMTLLAAQQGLWPQHIIPMGVGGCSMLGDSCYKLCPEDSRLTVLKGRVALALPDRGMTEKWRQLAHEVMTVIDTDIRVSDITDTARNFEIGAGPDDLVIRLFNLASSDGLTPQAIRCLKHWLCLLTTRLLTCTE